MAIATLGCSSCATRADGGRFLAAQSVLGKLAGALGEHLPNRLDPEVFPGASMNATMSEVQVELVPPSRRHLENFIGPAQLGAIFLQLFARTCSWLTSPRPRRALVGALWSRAERLLLRGSLSAIDLISRPSDRYAFR